jgi:hypothetical protein
MLKSATTLAAFSTEHLQMKGGKDKQREVRFKPRHFSFLHHSQLTALLLPHISVNWSGWNGSAYFSMEDNVSAIGNC